MNVAGQYGKGGLFLLFMLGIVGIVNSQNGFNISSTLQPPPPSSTQMPIPGPSSMAVPSSPPTPNAGPGQITCCYVQTACDNCTETFKVNSIVYCCPFCRGMVLVTDLLCRCTIPMSDPVRNLNCKLSNTVVGGYAALRPSYYDNGSEVLKSCLVVVASGILASVMLWDDNRGGVVWKTVLAYYLIQFVSELPSPDSVATHCYLTKNYVGGVRGECVVCRFQDLRRIWLRYFCNCLG